MTTQAGEGKTLPKPSGDIAATSKEVGFVTSIKDYLVYLEGLPSAKINDIIVTGEGARAIVASLERDRIEALMLDYDRPKPGEMFTIYPKGIDLPLGNTLLDRCFDPLGNPLDTKGYLSKSDRSLQLEVEAPGIDARKIISQQLITGITIIDTLIPIGRGQRELIYGEPRSGKSYFLFDLILNQKGKDTICIYAALGKPEIDVKRLINDLNKSDAGAYSILVAASSNAPAPLIALAPSVALSIAEHFRDAGKSVLLLFDDMGTHAKYLREIALLSGQTPGRESYPADIFYQHSQLIERAGNFNTKHGDGSITLLPMIETGVENITNLIPTNLMSATDGHLLFSSSLRSQGYYPAVDPAISVTRVGHQTQSPLQKVLADRLRSLLARYQEIKRFGQFGPDLTPQTQLAIKKGIIATELLKQDPGQNIPIPVQIVLLSLLFGPFFDDKNLEFVRRNKQKILSLIGQSKEYMDLVSKDSQNLDTLIEQLNTKLPLLEAQCQ